jgi:uncharacterized membrane protein YhaH (DUF805 family)
MYAPRLRAKRFRLHARPHLRVAAASLLKHKSNMDWYIEVLNKYAVFSGRARRKEYWYFALFNVIITVVLAIISQVFNSMLHTQIFDLLNPLYSLAVLVPSLAVTVRRLHDTDRSGWWILISLIPLVGAIVLLVFTVQDSTPGDNRFGPNPKEVAV